MKIKLIPVLACAAILAPALMASTPVAAGERGGGNGGSSGPTAGEPSTVAEGLLGPLSLEVDRSGEAYLSQNFAGVLTRVNADGSTTDIASGAPGDEIGAVSSARGIVYFSQSAPDLSASVLKSIDTSGVITELADLRGYEEEVNPDQINTYGFVDLPTECAALFPADPMAPTGEAYSGLVDSHPYASYATSDGVYIADAGANAVLWVNNAGEISTVAVLPAEDPVVITAEVAMATGLPDCVVGYDYIFEPVPTDVERGADGWLYVTTLPGGPENSSLGARGSVYRVAPEGGDVERVATGFVGATNLAVSDDGTIFVAELFGGDGTGQVSYVAPGAESPSVLLTIASPAAIELRDTNLWVTSGAFVPDETGAPQAIGELTRVPLVTESGAGGSNRGHDGGHGRHGD